MPPQTPLSFGLLRTRYSALSEPSSVQVLQQGILLLTTDHRHRPAAQQLDDFGTEQYDSSIVLFFSVGPLKPGSRGDGHYETVCLSSADEDVVHTVFERHHPLLCSLRAWAASHADERTLDHERMQHVSYSALQLRPDGRGALPFFVTPAKHLPPRPPYAHRGQKTCCTRTPRMAA